MSVNIIGNINQHNPGNGHPQPLDEADRRAYDAAFRFLSLDQFDPQEEVGYLTDSEAEDEELDENYVNPQEQQAPSRAYLIDAQQVSGSLAAFFNPRFNRREVEGIRLVPSMLQVIYYS